MLIQLAIPPYPKSTARSNPTDITLELSLGKGLALLIAIALSKGRLTREKKLLNRYIMVLENMHSILKATHEEQSELEMEML